MLTNLFLTIGFFVVFFVLMGIGFLLRGTVLNSSCGGAAKLTGDQNAACACAKKDAEICPSDDKSGLLKLSQIGNPHRTMKERGEFHV